MYDEFDWDLVRPPAIPLSDKVIYELHVRGYTIHPSSGVAHPGTYEGLIEKIPYLKELGVTTVELLPVYEFDENENQAINPLTGERLLNFWGYSPICFFAPKAAYAVDGRGGRQVAEFKRMVREFHRAGLEVFLDVVFNHTAEGSGRPGDPTYSFRGLDNPVYYLLDPQTGDYQNYSGCGNTINCNHPVVRSLIIDALRYWVAETHVDGFRFDLASILGRGRGGEVLANPPLLERIAYDPVLANSMLIAEAWDAAGLYQVGSFPAWRPLGGMERPVPRRRAPLRARRPRPHRQPGAAPERQRRPLPALRAPPLPLDQLRHLPRRLHPGRSGLVQPQAQPGERRGQPRRRGRELQLELRPRGPGRRPWHSRPARPPDAQLPHHAHALAGNAHAARRRRARPHAGRQQQPLLPGQRDELGRLDAARQEPRPLPLHQDADRLPARPPVLRHPNFLTGRTAPGRRRPDVTWHGVRLGEPDFTAISRSLAMHLAGDYASTPDCDIYLAVNAWIGDLDFELPTPPPGSRWVRAVDTAAAPPHDIAEEGAERELTDPSRLLVRARSCIVLRSKVLGG